MKLAIGSDHGGFQLKQKIIEHLTAKGHQISDLGCFSTDSCDYPAFGHAVGKAVAEGAADFGIVICETGIGISISANKMPGVRAGLCLNEFMAKRTRLHNDANVLALGAELIGPALALEIVDTFLSTEFSGVDRHARRISQIEQTT